MHINEKLITSIESLKRHFDFQVVFSNIDIFIRDFKPNEIPYFDEASKLLYRIIASPQTTKIDSNNIIYNENETYKLKHNDESVFNNVALSDYTAEDKIRIIALYELIDKPVDYGQIQPLTSSTLSEGELILMKGQSLTFVKADPPAEIYSRLIRINKNVESELKLGEIILNAGNITFGLFSKSGLYKLLKPYDCNSTYELRLLEKGGNISLCVTDQINNQEHVLLGVQSFCAFGEDNYLYIANNQVYSHHDYQLQKRLKDEISILDTPMAVEIIQGEIIITMKDCTEKRIMYKKL